MLTSVSASPEAMPSRMGRGRFVRLREEIDKYNGKARVIAFAVSLVYAMILWLNYKNFIHPAFSYMAFVFYKHSPAALSMDMLLAALPALFLPLSLRRPSDLALILLFIIVFIPSEILTTSAVTIVTSDIIAMKLFLVITLAMLMLIAGGDQRRSALVISFTPFQMMVGFVALAAACVGVVGMTYGYKIVLHNLSDVYTQRGAYKEELADAGYNSYLVGLICMVLAPGLISYGLVFRRWMFVGAGTFLALYIFSITGLKTAFMSVLYTGVLYGGVTAFRRNFLLAAVIGAIVLQLVAMLLASGSLEALNSLFVRRTFMMQGLLTTYYHDYYSGHPFLYLSQSILSPFISSPQAMSPDDLIGQVYFKGGEHANASIWSDGFANGGFIGMAVSVLITGLLLRALNYSLSRSDLRFACCAMSMIFFMTCQTGIIKVIGTHGALIACVLYMFGEIRKPSGAERRDPLARAAMRRREAAIRVPGAQA